MLPSLKSVSNELQNCQPFMQRPAPAQQNGSNSILPPVSTATNLGNLEEPTSPPRGEPAKQCEFEKEFVIEDLKEDEAPDAKFEKRTDIEHKSRIFTTLLPLFGEVSKVSRL
jgi:hypothetical protein